MDAAVGAIIGVVVGSFFSLGGTFLTQWYALKKDREQWTRQQEAERELRQREAESAEREYVRDLYHNCVYYLSTYVSAYEGDVAIDKDLRLKSLEEAQKWVSLLLLHRKAEFRRRDDATFRSDYGSFSHTGNRDSAIRLRDRAITLAMNDRLLNPDLAIPDETETQERQVTIQIDKEFRRQQFANGVELPLSHTFTVALPDLTSGQREKLWRIFIDEAGQSQVPIVIKDLWIPGYDKPNKDIRTRRTKWAARVNPLSSEPKDIFAAWERDYDEALARAEQELEQAQG